MLNVTGMGTFSTTALPVGTHTVTASYSGDAADAPSASQAVTVAVVPVATPSYTMAVSTSDVSVSRGQVANLTLTVTPLNGFNAPVQLSCSGLPAGTTCKFDPPVITPDGAPVSSTLSILVAPQPSATAQNKMPQASSRGRTDLGLVMPWGILSLMGLSRRRSRVRGKGIRMVLLAVLLAGSLWISGCGYSVNGSIFTMTLTSSGANAPTQTTHVTVSIVP